jgi:hypothetical protein
LLCFTASSETIVAVGRAVQDLLVDVGNSLRNQRGEGWDVSTHGRMGSALRLVSCTALFWEKATVDHF